MRRFAAAMPLAALRRELSSALGPNAAVSSCPVPRIFDATMASRALTVIHLPFAASLTRCRAARILLLALRARRACLGGMDWITDSSVSCLEAMYMVFRFTLGEGVSMARTRLSCSALRSARRDAMASARRSDARMTARSRSARWDGVSMVMLLRERWLTSIWCSRSCTSCWCTWALRALTRAFLASSSLRRRAARRFLPDNGCFMGCHLGKNIGRQMRSASLSDEPR